MAIYITGDCHGDFRRLLDPRFSGADKNDYLLVCGDFGGIWSGAQWEEEMMDRLERELPYTLLWIDGNHEGFDHLKSYQAEYWRGGMVQYICPHVIHLMRGYEYTIEKKRFWVMGGARSIDITDGLLEKDDPLLKEKILDLKRQGKNYFRIRGINWFPEEMPSEEERERGMECLQKNGMKTDYIITHAASTMVSNYFSAWRFQADELTEYFEIVREKVQFKKWFCGHYHTDEELVVEGKNFQILYSRIERIY